MPVAAQLSLWECRTHTPTWDDVHAGSAVLIDRVVPCDHCRDHWHHRACDSTPEHYAFPMSRGDGTCKRHYAVWPEDVRDTDVVR